MERNQPNPSTGGRPPTMRPTSTAAQGVDSDPGAGGSGELVRVHRILRVQLSQLSDEEWGDLRKQAAESARFCNAILAEHYCKALGWKPPEDGDSTFVRLGKAGTLSGDARVALAREAFTTWKRHAKKILSGTQRLALFQADRCLVTRGEHMSKGKRQRHAWVWFDGKEYRLSVILRGKDSGGRQEFGLRWKPQSDEYISPVMDRLASGDARLLKVTFAFERPGRKVFALLCYEGEAVNREPGERSATLGPLEKDGTLWLRIEGANGRIVPLNYTAKISRLLQMKEHFYGIQRRLRQRTRRSGKGSRRDYRDALTKAGSFSNWGHGFIHEWSREIVTELERAGVGHLSIAPISVGELPMSELEEKLKYKLMEAGIEMARLDPAEKTTANAIERVMAKRETSAAKVKKALGVVRRAVSEKELA